MAKTVVYFYRDPVDGSVPLVEWLDELPRKVKLKCVDRLRRLGELGHELRRPEADFLRAGIHELRASYQGVHYRMLYFFAGQAVVVISHGLTKEREIPAREIERAVMRMQLIESEFDKFTYRPG